MKIKNSIRNVKALFLVIGFILLSLSSIKTLAVEHEPIRDGLTPGEVRLTKTAKAVDGMVNQWDINVKVEGRNIFPPPDTDIVLVIDNSNSMSQKTDGLFAKTRMEKAKDAATKFVEQVLKEDYNNRIGIITYGTKGKHEANLGGFDQKKKLLRIINGGWSGIIHQSGIKPNGGGTHTQEGIKMGMELLEEQATASRRILVLISDGVPTYSYSVKSPYNTKEYMTQDLENNRYVTSEEIPESGFKYPTWASTNRLGNGRNMFLHFGSSFSKTYYSMGNHAISESNIWKEKKKPNGDKVATDIYTIGVDMKESDEEQFLGTVNVLYQDEEGNELATRDFSGEVDVDTYKTEQLDFEGYTFKSVKGPTEGTFSETPIEVTYTYSKNSNKKELNETVIEGKDKINEQEDESSTNQGNELDGNENEITFNEGLSPISFTDLNIKSANVPENGMEVLKKIASKPSMCFSATGDGLENTLKQIGNEILSAVKNGSVNDPMGDGFELTVGENVKVSQGSYKINASNTIDWEVGTLTVPKSDDPEEDIMYAEMNYRIDANQSVLAKDVLTEDGFAKTNGKTTFDYIDSNNKNTIKEFKVPTVKPTIVSLQKKLFDQSGNLVTNSDEKFSLELEEDNYGQGKYDVKPEQKVQIVHPWNATKEYKFEELLTSDQKYKVETSINDTTTNGPVAKMKFDQVANEEYYEHQKIIVTNRMELAIEKRYLYIRQSVLDPSENMVIPTTGYHKLYYEGANNSTMNLTSKSTTNDDATNVNEKLFSKLLLPKKFNSYKQVNIFTTIPQYYEQVGYIVTKDKEHLGERHISKNKDEFITTASMAILDYSDTNENWITIFIKPNSGNRSKNVTETDYFKFFSWDYKTNEFGEINNSR